MIRIEQIDNELILNEDTLMTSNTHLVGKITYANYNFIHFSDYSKIELIGANIIGHSFMLIVIFKVLWDNIIEGREINVFVVNRNKDNLYYWVFANVTPFFNKRNEIMDYPVRRKLNLNALATMKDICKALLNDEKLARESGKNMSISLNLLGSMLNGLKLSHQKLFIKLQSNGKI